MTIVFLRTRQDDRDKEELQKVEDIRGSPLSVGTMEEIIDDNHCIISTPNGPEYYVAIMSFVDRDQLEPKCTVLLHNKVREVSRLMIYLVAYVVTVRFRSSWQLSVS